MKTIWIVGGSTGIGRELAIQLALASYCVVVSARNTAKLEQLAERHNISEQLFTIQLDATDEGACQQVWQTINQRYGKVDWVFLNAAIYEPASVVPFEQRKWRDIAHTNIDVVLNPLATILAQSDLIPEQLFITTSLAGYRGLPKSGGYGMSKAALISLAESIQPELAALGCRVRLITPGFIDTQITAKNRFRMPAIISAEEAAQQIIKKINAKTFEIAFPWRFVIWIKLLRFLPYRWFFLITGRMVKK
ncbi:SDR family NAD(P)-dependent oxidoreductase [Endozoicomonas sp. SM1973]|uniref:SDR family NAD(P)-dependent oxidoreductase n=1 Tax=Spartinivicinus marinus TaxID=2994442 RepID=A0A853I157_9GAMM|nr:SDR family NAD(P)-dependent oxidoreductase [Spartinivicinus marinus]MCX4025018.1 SDR family NAD(P)-dependent oxidoreductase [Spartinivicinus marinus]NYZ67710.1 SDR family NAD(P)-dependent oxidoreductase [Spartinivicinus marinus]